MATYEEILNWKPLEKMENATEELYLERMNAVMDVELPNGKLVLIPFVAGTEIVHYSTKELIAVCPVTFLPDTYHLTISFMPDKHIPELKSLKKYLTDYFRLPISHEHLAGRIHRDFSQQIKPKYTFVRMVVAIRGGIETVVEVGNKCVEA